MEISWNDHVRNDVLHSVNEKRSILSKIKSIKSNWIGHMFLIKHIIAGGWGGRKDKGDGKTGRRRKQLLDHVKETRGYWTLKEEAPNYTPWRTRFGRGYGNVVGQRT